ncbi:hypothetical protein VTH06DRAFT_3273 [Thermothelomyces fergusii]
MDEQAPPPLVVGHLRRSSYHVESHQLRILPRPDSKCRGIQQRHALSHGAGYTDETVLMPSYRCPMSSGLLVKGDFGFMFAWTDSIQARFPTDPCVIQGSSGQLESSPRLRLQSRLGSRPSLMSAAC